MTSETNIKTNENAETIVELRKIIKRYDDNIAVDSLSLDVKRGEILGLLGPNGAGKSTTINITTGLTSADSGEVILFGQSLKGQANAVKKRMGVVPQNIVLYDMLTARENLNCFGRLYGIKGTELKENVEYALEMVGLLDVGKKPPKKFSGGMKRRLNIACAIVHRPELLIMDEPTVGIDPQSRNHILNFVQQYAKDNRTVIYTSHYMEEVERLCDRVIIMDEGRIIANGTVEELTRTILFEENVLLDIKNPSPTLLEQVKAVNGVINCELSGRRLKIASRPNSGNIARILEVAASYEILGVVSQKPNLEDVFLSLTGKKLRDEEK